MLVSYKWLKELVAVDVPSAELAEKMSTSGIEVEGVIQPNKGLSNIVVGFVKECVPHPDSDHLSICTVNVGETDDLTIVCGAPNIKAGIKVIVALVGARIADNHKIKKGKIRGIVSLGMICSLQELGIAESVVPKQFAEGIYYLPDNAVIGQAVDTYLGIDDEIIDLSITPNRADALSMRGVAHEVGAVYNLPVSFEPKQIRENARQATELLSVKIENPTDAPTYQMRIIENVTVQPSPVWLQNRLMLAGIRPINNVVDVTNFVLLYFGQPLHSFDFDKFKGNQIVVRRANDQESLTTLDGEKRQLSAEDLVITNNNEPVAIAGVMGGEATEIDNQSKTVALEAALFDPQLVRKTSQKFNLRSESSARFEKGINQATVNEALDYAAQMIAELGQGEVLSGTISSGAFKASSIDVGTTVSKLNRSLGTDLALTEIVSIFERLGFNVQTIGEDIMVTIPPRRWDIKIEADLVEEVARIYGYDKLPSTLPVGQTLIGELTAKQRLMRQSRELLEGYGLTETISYALTTVDKSCQFAWQPSNLTALDFPMSEERSVLRQSIITEMLTSISYNQARKNKNIAFYEIGKVFEQKHDPKKNLPTENTHIAIALSGNRLAKDFQTEETAYDFTYLKGIIESYFSALNISVAFEKYTELEEMHPGRTASILLNNQMIGFLGQIHPKMAKAFAVEATYVAEFDLQAILAVNEPIIFSEISKFQAVNRDIAFLVDEAVTYQAVLEVIQSAKTNLLKSARLFDIFQGDKLPQGKKSLAYRLVFESSEATLTDEQIEQAVNKITKQLVNQLGVEIR
ncbi:MULTISPECIES: phenylalanine--tRNA ligase subunit beta [unclassified Enterococcus]|uniref:phenylalanine--tRNA ligase subunit beta n=1 Tax=unclassified Enterococcus TaxID=2608891 RepID=UPI001556CFE5|nr:MULTISPECIES: phenylalanine--tRNA ligase subunit beta [unclassified Enterococcus]MBS7576160.1 phenylalanine--tRNA ligase subunit beta [Enterococcus sp. MMGLQ5-2]MBS7583393.1 phenylalanine--tRNA ligase subunit beta [Enterococcus sp. MMGLQ5-1]NPD11253.1 phenylalanine--tRNA ligase subunit beta [Enterococcus sp. MMGLQ5-1]NPD35996.1 phenylalanine--tRNA ligase subunit beta [Enterococcus sp. MMGLQ5-2]